MVFDITGKVAIITGGASGIGLYYTKELLRNGAKGVTLADVSNEFGAKALEEIQTEFGTDKAIFVKTDVTKIQQVEDTFKQTIEKFNNVDILINNAGIMNDAVWEQEIAINLNGTIHGILVGMEKYLPKYKQGEEAVIVNMSSVMGTESFSYLPIYSATKHAILGLTKCWGTAEHYETTKVRVVAVCPGKTWTPLVFDFKGRTLGERYEQINQEFKEPRPGQNPDFLVKEAIRVIQNAPNGTAWIVDGGKPAYHYNVPHRHTMENNVL